MQSRRAHIRRHRASTRLKKRLAIAAILVLSSSTALSLYMVRDIGLDQPAQASMERMPGLAGTTGADTPALAPQARRIYRYSVVPGGVANRDELAHAVRTDGVVAAHYASFDLRKAGAITVGRPRAVYVSYRKGDRVYWTPRKVMLAAGETVLSDGHSQIRARCGNRISDLPQQPVEARGPTEEELDTSVAAAQTADGALQLASSPLDEQGEANAQPDGRASFRDGAGLATANTVAARSAPGQDGWPAATGASSGSGSSPYAPLSGRLGVPGTPVSAATADGSGTVGSGSGTTVTAGTVSSGSTPDGATAMNPLPAPAASKDAGSGITAAGTSAGTPAGQERPSQVVVTPPPAGTLPKEPARSLPSKQASANVPEPDTLWLGAAGFAAMWLLRRRKPRSTRG